MCNTILVCGLAVFLSLAMAGAWAIARHPGQSGWTDAIWTFALGFAGVVAALIPHDGALGVRQNLVAVLIGFWAFRLGVHITRRTAKSGDDPRYAAMRTEWGDAFSQRLFIFLQIQAAASLILVLCVVLAAHNPEPKLVWSDAIGALIVIVSVIGEGIADAQLTQFRATASAHNRVCDVGLWAYSRHPNYFFEWFGWLAYAVIAIGPSGSLTWGWLALIAPIFMYVLLVYVSGVPPLEAHMLRSRGAAFEEYQARVSAFWPWISTSKPEKIK